MSKAQARLIKILEMLCPTEGPRVTAIPGVHCVKISNATPKLKRPWGTYLGYVVQGRKEITLGKKTYLLKEGVFSATMVPLPVISRILDATPDKPFLAVLIDLKAPMFAEIASELRSGLNEVDPSSVPASGALLSSEVDAKMDAAMVRLIEQLRGSEDAKVLGDIALREVFYYLLKSAVGPQLRNYVNAGSKMHQISQAIHLLHSSLHKEIDVEALAKRAHLSRSVFFKHFKEVTAVSPIQYQKRLRLIEARRLMVEQGQSAEQSAYQVGYKSASQFSREYTRMFGKTPLGDKQSSKAA